jgi:hypothetical protein
MQKIALSKGVWFYDLAKPLGKPGGFGAVYEGFSTERGELAVKRLHLTANDAAHREMRIASDLAGRHLSHVIPVLDAGEDPESSAYFVVMPKAEKSLQGAIDGGVTFSGPDAARILLDIANALAEVNDIVHRDLKPANILLHENKWKVADFGIARFVEDSTSLQTLKGCLSPPYAAPEQWQNIHATSATDVYALGCIGYALLTGRPPFFGPSGADFREQHLHADPPKLPPACPPRLQTLLSMMLRKASGTRPSLERARALLNEVVESPSASPEAIGFGVLAQAGAHIARAQAEVERAQQQQLSATGARNHLADAGRTILGAIVERLLARIQSEAPNAERRGFAITLGRGHFEISLSGSGSFRPKGALPADAFNQSRWDVVAGEEIVVHQEQPPYQWSASLWFCRLPNTSDFRWYEVSYFSLKREDVVAPFSLTRKASDADLAASPVMHIYQLAFGPIAIDDEDQDDFTERWAALLGLASQGKLGHPRNLPLPAKFWRQSFVA